MKKIKILSVTLIIQCIILNNVFAQAGLSVLQQSLSYEDEDFIRSLLSDVINEELQKFYDRNFGQLQENMNSFTFSATTTSGTNPGVYNSQTQLPVNIAGTGALNRDIIIQYIISKGSAMQRDRIENLVSLYIQEANTEGINYDIAIAQMCYATGFLNNQNLVNTTRNFGGLNTDQGISVNYNDRHASDLEGVRAHIQHLKGYTSTARPVHPIIDKRYDLLARRGILGTVQTLDGLFGIWSPNAAYGNEITKILRELYSF